MKGKIKKYKKMLKKLKKIDWRAFWKELPDIAFGIIMISCAVLLVVLLVHCAITDCKINSCPHKQQVIYMPMPIHY